MKRHIFILAVVLSACGWTQGATNEQTHALVCGNSDFALRLYKTLSKPDGNLLFSPFSISMALSMTSAGADGDTLEEMKQVLALGQAGQDYHTTFDTLCSEIGRSSRNSGVPILVRNALWIEKEIEPEPAFKDIITAKYRAKLTRVDFASQPGTVVAQMNTWVRESTGNRISDFIKESDISSTTALVLINTIFFKGEWRSRFPKDNTRMAPFFVTPTRTVDVPMMAQKAYFKYRALPDLAVLEMPYINGGFSLLVLLPQQKDGLKKLEETLTVEQLNQWRTGLSDTEVKVYFPKFAFECDIALNQVLSSLGMTKAFTPGVADFRRISLKHQLYVNKAIHHAGIELDEEGTTAWAATDVEQLTIGAMFPPPPPVFRADHPFLFILTETSTGSILFMGRIVDFSAESGRKPAQ